MSHERFSGVLGAVLVGGQSSRFGSNKALFLIDDLPMARVIADKMYAAEITQVVVVGDTPSIANSLDLDFIADSYPGQGPLGGLITVMQTVAADVLCVLPCDVPQISSDSIRQLVNAVLDCNNIDMAILATADDHWLCSSLRVSTCLPILIKRFAAGERAIHRAVSTFEIKRIFVTEWEATNVNTLDEAPGPSRTTEFGD